MSTKVWFPFVSLWCVLYLATLHWCLPWMGYKKDKREGREENEEEEGMEWVREVFKNFISVSVGVRLSLYVYWQLAARQVIFLTCIQWSLFSASPPPQPGENINTRNTNPLTHMEIYIIPMHPVYLPIQLTPLLCSLSLLPSSSLFLAVRFCDWQVLCDPADPQQQSLHGGGGQQVWLQHVWANHDEPHRNHVYPSLAKDLRWGWLSV